MIRSDEGQRWQTDRDALMSKLIESGAVADSPTAIRCPFHDDKTPSMGVYKADDGVWRAKCHASACGFLGDIFDVEAKYRGVPVEEVIRNIVVGDSPPTRDRTYDQLEELLADQHGVEDHYRYSDPDTGRIELVVIRKRIGERKAFVQAHQRTDGKWIMRAPPKPWPLLNRRNLRASQVVIVVEGEKCVKALFHQGFINATTSPGGAGKGEHADWSCLAGKIVILWPDNDKAGRDHVRGVADVLLRLSPPATVKMIEPNDLELGEKQDAADLIERLVREAVEFKMVAKDHVTTMIQNAIRCAVPITTSTELTRHLQATIRGEHAVVDLPWLELNAATQALLPGAVTVLCGDPGSSKSFAIMQMLRFWLGMDIHADVLMLEDDKAYHLMRALCQLSGCSSIFSTKWIQQNPDRTMEYANKHAPWLDRIADHLFTTTEAAPTYAAILAWIEERSRRGARVIVVDPVTIIQSEKPWVADAEFLDAAKKLAREYGASHVYVSHPRKGSGGANLLDDVAGGAAWSRFAHTVLLLKPNDKGTLRVAVRYDGQSVGTEPAPSGNRVILAAKCRNGPGHGLRVLYEFRGDDLMLHECGVIVDD